MRCAIVFAALVAAAAATPAQGPQDDECRPKFPPGEKHKHIHHGDCCSAEVLPETFKAAFETCHQKLPHPPRPDGPPPEGVTGPPPEIRKHHACMGECLFEESGLLTADKHLDVKAVMGQFVSTDPDLGPLLKTAVDMCLSSYESDVDQSLECKSGADEFHNCVSRAVFLSCPAALWTESAECAELKTKTAKCPKMPVRLGKKPSHGPPK